MNKIDDRDYQTRKKFLSFILNFITDNRISKFESALAQRTRYLTIVLEDIYQPHNASAVLRSCDCFGIQDVHIIENKNKYEVNPDVALGSAKWLSLIKYNKEADNTSLCLKSLKGNGYKIVATSPHQDDFTPDTLPLDQKVALVFGTELEGLTENAKEMADAFVRIPMYGFTESLNISVSAALLLFTVSERLRKSTISWHLSEEERTGIMLQWARNTVKRSDALEREFLRKIEKEEF
jgi:tRNA (guanosine-2'-O-)-methyltransferase